jgi:hypothetical protein
MDATVRRSATNIWKAESSRTLERTHCIPAESVRRNEGQCDEWSARAATDLSTNEFQLLSPDTQTDHVAAVFSFPSMLIKMSGNIVGITK